MADRHLHEAVWKGDLSTFLKLIQGDEDSIKNRVLGSGNTVLHLAARYGHVDLASEMVKMWPEMVVAENAEFETPLHEACREGHVEMMKMLIAANEGVVYKVNRRDESALFAACERNRVEVVKHLLMEFPLLLMMEVDSMTCSIHAAASGGYTEIVKEILKVRPEFAQKRNSQGCTPLHLACNKGHLEITRELLRLDPDLSNLRDNQDGSTPLHFAATRGRVSIIDEILITSLQSASMVTIHGDTILHLAVKNNHFEALRYLTETLDVTDLLNVQNKDGNTVLHLATSGKLNNMVLYLVKIGVEVNAINRKGYTALDVVVADASNSGPLAIIPTLLDAGAKKCHQLPPGSCDISQIVDSNPITTTETPWRNNMHLNSPVNKTHHRRHNHRRAKQIEHQNEGLRNARNTITVVAVLIATVTFAGGINPPGGFNQETGKATMGRMSGFKVFMVCNIVALFLSLGIVNVLVSVIPFRRKSMTKLLVATHKLMWVSTLFMASAYIAAVWTILPRGPGSIWLRAELLFIGVGCTMVVLLALGALLVRQWSRKREWRSIRREKKSKDGSANSSLNSRVGEMNIRNKHESSSNSDVDSSDNGYHVY